MALYKYVDYYYYFFFDPGTQFPGNEKITLCNMQYYYLSVLSRVPTRPIIHYTAGKHRITSHSVGMQIAEWQCPAAAAAAVAIRLD